MAQRLDGSREDVREAHETAVALQVAWFVALARAVPKNGDVLRHDPDIRSAQVSLIRALLLACGEGIPLEALRARFIDPVGRESRVSAGAALLLTEAVELVDRHLARRTAAEAAHHHGEVHGVTRAGASSAQR